MFLQAGTWIQAIVRLCDGMTVWNGLRILSRGNLFLASNQGILSGRRSLTNFNRLDTPSRGRLINSRCKVPIPVSFERRLGAWRMRLMSGRLHQKLEQRTRLTEVRKHDRKVQRQLQRLAFSTESAEPRNSRESWMHYEAGCAITASMTHSKPSKSDEKQ